MLLVSHYIVGPVTSDQLGSGDSVPDLSDQHFDRAIICAWSGGRRRSQNAESRAGEMMVLRRV